MLIKETVDRLIEFYEPYFSNDENKTREFIKQAVDTRQKRNIRAIILQTQRLIYLADNADKIKPSRDALKLLFLIICAEAVAKLYKNFEEEGQSRYYVKMFFQEICDPQDWDSLSGAIITDKPRRPSVLSSVEFVDFLYEVRCSVVHEGRYWEFRFKDKSKLGVPFCYFGKTETTVVVGITYEELRDIIVRGAIKAINTCLVNE